MSTYILQVSGMSCMGCVNSVKRLLSALDGLVSVDVDLGSGQVKVSCEGAQCTPDSLTRAIEEGGYQVTQCTAQ